MGLSKMAAESVHCGFGSDVGRMNNQDTFFHGCVLGSEPWDSVLGYALPLAANEPPNLPGHHRMSDNLSDSPCCGRTRPHSV